MTTEFLVPRERDVGRHMHDPYTTSGARSILRRFRVDVIDMLDEMVKNLDLYDGGKTFLAKSPLRSKVYVAAAMKTLGLIEEVPSPNGACAVRPTEKAIKQIEALRSYL